MPKFATAFAPATARPSLSETLALVSEAGATIADLRARLACAERTVAVLEEEKRAAQAELRALRQGTCEPDRPAETQPNRSHLDDALSALVEGLGPALVRVGP